MVNLIKGTIQEIAFNVAQAQHSELEADASQSGGRERTIFVLGSKEVGKTSMIQNFLGRDDVAPKPTLALEYGFTRRSGTGQDILQQVCNVWELGSLTNSHHLIDIPIRSHSPNTLSVVIVLDLSQPDRLWADLERALNGLKQSLAENEHIGQTASRSLGRVGASHADLATLSLLPVPVLIVGGKYDKFQDFDPEIKKHVCRCLRSISHTIGAALLFVSTRNASQMKTLRDIFNHLGFGSPMLPIRQTDIDYNGPLAVWFGNDSWTQIGVLPSNSERIEMAFSKHIPQAPKFENNDWSGLPDPAKDSGFREPSIDELRSQKDEELMRLIRDSEFRTKFQAVIS